MFLGLEGPVLSILMGFLIWTDGERVALQGRCRCLSWLQLLIRLKLSPLLFASILSSTRYMSILAW